MIKTFYENMKNFLEDQYQKKPRAFDSVRMQVADTVLEAFKPDSRVVWVSWLNFPMELLAAFDVATFDPELGPGLVCTLEADRSMEVMSEAEQGGFSIDLCSAHRLALGCQLKGYMPKADILLGHSYFCDGSARVNRLLAQYHGKEAVTLDMPFGMDKKAVVYVAGQLQYVARKIEEATGARLDMDKLRESIRASNRARRALNELAELQKDRPVSWNGTGTVAMSLFQHIKAGKPVQEQIYRELIDECRNNLESGALKPENYRVLWLAWYPAQPFVTYEVFKKNGVKIVMGEQTRAFWEEIDENNPWESLAMRDFKSPYAGPIEQRLEGIMKIIDEYHIDGVVHFSHDACRHTCAAHRMIGDAVQKRGVPFLALEGDISDKRKYSEDRTRLLLESFIDVMAARK
ncbi:MAG: 2-hydroxyacyl-CoA dehydratase family protein [Dehalococcoidia bacterium]|nr:2-hydroxyacyl-CoA dehydratase family protein [Dehalococcoidia bacterium]MDD5495158.1 2-hydroxyacyl-CoA dehydratase family protein [Dehalococcoidia bacterium]